MTGTREPSPEERLVIVCERDGTNFLGRAFPTREEAIDAAAMSGPDRQRPRFVAEVAAVID